VTFPTQVSAGSRSIARVVPVYAPRDEDRLIVVAVGRVQDDLRTGLRRQSEQQRHGTQTEQHTPIGAKRQAPWEQTFPIPHWNFSSRPPADPKADLIPG
jgi:hypothetical protein